MSHVGGAASLPTSSMFPLVAPARDAQYISDPGLRAGVLPFDGCDLHYWLGGKKDAPVVVFNHALGVDHHMFDEQAQALLKSYRVLLWDLRGHGESVADRPFSLEQSHRDLLALLDHLDIEQVTLVGISLGGYVSQWFAHYYPDRIDGQVLISCPPINVLPSSFERWVLGLTKKAVRWLPFWFVRARSTNSATVRREVHSYLDRALENSGRDTFISAWNSMVDGFVDAPQVELPGPTLVVYGTYDRIIAPSHFQNIWRTVNSGVEQISVPGAGHAVVQDNPSFCNKMLADFLNRRVYVR